MKPAPFDYLDPPDLDGVLAVLADRGDDALVIGGGQSLVPLLNLRLARPEVVVDPRHVVGLDIIEVGATSIEVGALVTATDLIEHPDAARVLPGLIEAVRDIGHVQIRNRTTIGGSIAHADPAAELPAALSALEGSVVLRSAAGTRVLPADEFFEGPFATARRSDELVTAVRFGVPAAADPGGSVATGWLEQARRPGDFALVGVFASVRTTAEGSVEGGTIALSGVAGRPVRAASAEASLRAGGPVADVAAAVGRDIEPPDDVHGTGAHRRALAEVLTNRLLTGLMDRRVAGGRP